MKFESHIKAGNMCNSNPKSNINQGNNNTKKESSVYSQLKNAPYNG